ncbi:MAG: helix-turn-helix domain-containing protein [Candidatus Omnitrophica bacterium]|nr:helix-turn-helix domain-containing protein [Candidatus Omnitrophota bacterium]
MEKRYIGIKELSQYLSVPEKTIRWWVWQRQLPYRKFGRLLRFDLYEIEKWSTESAVAILK